MGGFCASVFHLSTFVSSIFRVGPWKMREARCVVVGLQMDANGKELLDWTISRVAEEGDRIVAVNVCRDSDLKNSITTLSLLSMLDAYFTAYEEACTLNNIALVGRVSRGNSIRKSLVKEAKLCAATKLVVGVNKHIFFRGSASVAKYCAKKLPTATVIAVQNGNVIFEKEANRSSLEELKSRRPQEILDSCVSMQIGVVTPNSQKKTGNRSQNEDDNKTEAVSESLFANGKNEVISHDSNCVIEEKIEGIPTSVTVLVQQLKQPELGWPLLRKAVQAKVEVSKAAKDRKLSVVQWVMTLPDRKLSLEQPLSRLTNELKAILSKNNSSCRWFHYNELLSSTNQFSSENLIGEGGSGRVYRGCLHNGLQVAVKLLKLSAKTTKDFLEEVDIITAMNHPNVVYLIGLCVEENTLISLYKYFPNGTLEGKLQDKNAKQQLTWDMRFKVAIGIAEALSYLHHGCSRPIIHRDVKSSNILLDDQFAPQLSDFGLAIREPKTSTNWIQNDIVGTFGYLAPEYFMYGNISNKIDVYAFGVVLLELLTGRKSIDDDSPKGEESLVMWASRILERGDLMDLLDPNLDSNYDKGQMRRMTLAASLCITRIPRLRPGIVKVCSLLQGEERLESWICRQADCTPAVIGCPDEAYQASRVGSHLGLELLDVDDDTSVVSSEQSYLGSWEEYLRGRWSHSSCFN